MEITAGGAIGDRLSIFNQGSGVGQIGVVGNDVTYNFGAGAVIIGSFSGGLNSGSPLVVSLNANAELTSTQALMRNLTFWNTSDNPATAARTIDFVLTDGDGGTSNTITQTATVTAAADAPVAVNDHSGLDFDGIDDYVSYRRQRQSDDDEYHDDGGLDQGGRIGQRQPDDHQQGR